MSAHAFTQRVLILGTNPLALRIAEALKASPFSRFTVTGFVQDRAESGGAYPDKISSPGSPVLGSLADFGRIVEESAPDRIIVALSERRGCMPVSDLLNLRMTGVLIEDGIEVHERFTGKLAIESLTPSFLIFSKDLRKPKIQSALQRALSLVSSVVGLVLTAPLFPLIAIAIKLDSQGPVFFIQERAGLQGRVFRLLKFRTMHPASGDENLVGWNRDTRSRVTRVGKWLRRFHLDELPQFINILKGDMNLVGPRPEIADNVALMAEKIPYYSLRYVVRPGLTGWAQIKNGYAVAQEEVTEKLRYDLYYIKHASLWLDLRILVETMKIILPRRGSP